MSSCSDPFRGVLGGSGVGASQLGADSLCKPTVRPSTADSLPLHTAELWRLRLPPPLLLGPAPRRRLDVSLDERLQALLRPQLKLVCICTCNAPAWALLEPPAAPSRLPPRAGSEPALEFILLKPPPGRPPRAEQPRNLTSPLRPGRVRGVPEMRTPRIRSRARQVRCLPG